MKNLKHAIVCMLAVPVALAAGQATAAAQSACVKVDAERDTLNEQNRKSAKILVEEELEEAGRTVVGSGCDGTYTVYNVKIGSTIIAHLRGPEGKRKLEAQSVDELPETYDQLVSALLENRAVGETTDRTNVTQGQQHQQRLSSESVPYLRLGFGGVVGGDFGSGPSVGIGLRQELNHVALDFSVLNGTFMMNYDTPRLAGSFARIGAEYLFKKNAPSTAFIGGGFAWGGVNTVENDTVYSQTGAQAEISGGYEFLRTADVRMIVRGNVVLPFYVASSSDGNDSIYTPSFTVDFALGL